MEGVGGWRTVENKMDGPALHGRAREQKARWQALRRLPPSYMLTGPLRGHRHHPPVRNTSERNVKAGRPTRARLRTDAAPEAEEHGLEARHEARRGRRHDVSKLPQRLPRRTRLSRRSSRLNLLLFSF